MSRNRCKFIALLLLYLFCIGCSPLQPTPTSIQTPAPTPTLPSEPVAIVPIRIPRPADSNYTNEGFLFASVANKLGTTLHISTCKNGPNLSYGYLLFDPKEPSCFHVNFLHFDNASINASDIHTFLIVTAIRDMDDSVINVGLALASVSINEKEYWGETMLAWVPKLQKMLGIPNQYFSAKTNIYAVYPLTGDQAKSLEPYRVDR